MRAKLSASLCLLVASCATSPEPISEEEPQAARGSVLDGRRTVLTDNGAWCWYQDERAIVDVDHPDGPMLLASSVSFGRPGQPHTGDVEVLWHNIATGEQGRYELHDRFEDDDHDSAALWVRPDGHYLAVYSMHSTDYNMRWRVSTRPHDPTEWQPEQIFRNVTHVCYSNVFPLESADGGEQLLNFSRSNGYDPNWFVSQDDGSTWGYGGKLHTGPGGNEATRQRPYVKYAAFGKKAVHFTTTEGHPHDEDNGLYHGYLAEDQLHGSDGKVLGPLSHGTTSELQTHDFTTVLKSGTEFDGVKMRHAWTVDMHVDSEGRPYTAFCARANGSPWDHRFLYARWTGDEWKVVELGKAGSFLYRGQEDYTGLVALHPHDPNVLFMSTPIDPRTGEALDHFEIFMGRTSDGGDHWAWAPVTWDSDTDNLRPIVPLWDQDHTALLWLHGRCHSYLSWDSEVVSRMIRTTQLDQLVVPGQATVVRPARSADQ